MAEQQLDIKKTRPETFYDIQEDTTRATFYLLGILTLLYISFFSAGFLVIGLWMKLEAGVKLTTFVWEGILGSSAIGVVVTLGHALVAYLRDVDTELDQLMAEELDMDDHYHRRLNNIVDELKIASGRTDLEVFVIPTQYRTALSLEDNHRAVVIVSEGALGVLRRDELQAVMAHEVAHVMYEDTRIKTFLHGLVSFFGGFKKLTNYDSPNVRVKGEGAVLVVALVVLTLIYQFITSAMAMTISKQREWRADATAVEYVRNPEALASALYKLGWYYRESNDLKTMQYVRYEKLSEEDYESLQIVPVSFRGEEASWTNLFQTHPPLFDRIEKLLAMTRTPFENLENQISHKTTRHFPVERVKNKEGVAVKDRDFWIEENGDRKGPMPFAEIVRGESFNPDTEIAVEQEGPTAPLRDLPLFQFLFSLREEGKMNHDCPECGGPLRRRHYLGVPLKACVICGGVGIKHEHLIRVACRYKTDQDSEKDPEFDEFRETPPPGGHPEEPFELSGDCPVCNNEFTKRYYGGNTSLVVDICAMCGFTWFEYNELQVACELA